MPLSSSDIIPPLWQQEKEEGGSNPTPKVPITPASSDEQSALAVHSKYVNNPSPENADAYLKTIKPWMSNAVRAYGGADASPSVWSGAKQIALDSAHKFDPNRGVKLRTFLLTHWQGLRRISAKTSTPVRIPEQTAIDAGRIASHEADLQSELGRHPSDAELADRTGISLERIHRARSSGGFLPQSIASENTEYMREDLKDSTKKAWLRYIYADLNPTDKIILEHSVGLHGQPILSTAEIAKKLKVSPGAISQRKTKIEGMLSELEQYAPKGGVE